ncbi:MAG: hypothetical protein ABW352_25560 [Polyangiales bacterium]
MRAVERLPWYLGGAFAISLGVVAVAHTPLGKPLLAGIGCPVLQAKPHELERARTQALAQRAGSERERTRPALGVLLARGGPARFDFELGESTRAHVEASITRRGGRCQAERADTALRCTLADVDGLFAQFADDKLVALDLFRTVTDTTRALSWLRTLERDLSARVGEATAHFGTFDASALRDRFAQSIVEYRYAGYVAQISALNTGAAIKLREQYQYLPGS